MKKEIFCMAAALILLTSCSKKEQAPTVQNTLTTVPQVVEEQPKFPELESLCTQYFPGCEYRFKNSKGKVEIKLTDAALTVENQPDHWDDLRAALESMQNDAHDLREKYSVDVIASTLEDSAGNILLSGFNGKIQFDVFNRSEPGNSNAGKPITINEYKQIQTGMTYAQVVSILGSSGTEEGSASVDAGAFSASSQIYSWDGAAPYSFVTVVFANGEVMSKSQINLE